MKKRAGNKIQTQRVLKVVILVIIVAYIIISLPKKCQNEECFSSKVQSCKAAYLTKEKDGNTYFYSTAEKLSNYLPYKAKNSMCFIEVTLKKTSPAASEDIKQQLEGKSMTCALPVNVLPDLDFEKVENILDFCHGELKESIYELVINRMHNLVLGNLNEIRSAILNEI